MEPALLGLRMGRHVTAARSEGKKAAPIQPKPQNSNVFASSSAFYLPTSLFLYTCEAVKREDFKTCEQSSFCKRHRGFAETMVKETQALGKGGSAPLSASPYQVLQNSVQLDGHTLTASVQHSVDNVPLKFEISFLESGMIRVRAQEKSPLKPRFDDTQKYVLRNEGQSLPYASPDSIKLVSTTVNGVTTHTVNYVNDNSTFSVRMSEQPWSLEYLVDGKSTIQLNTKGFLNFEHLREKPAEGEAEDASGSWEETFKTWTDAKPNGPESFGMDINFNGFEHVYGIPEHASSLSLKDTRGGGKDAYDQPYRMYNLDVFEYELDNPMALYGSIPFMVAHSAENTVGVFWMNAAETWIDVTREKSSAFGNLFSLGGSAQKQSVSTHWVSESGVLDVWLMPGPDVADVYRQYSDIVEQTPLPREFAIGYHQCRWNYIDQADVLAVHSKFHENNIPYDVLWLDIEHTDGKRYFTWDTSKFPDPVAMQEELMSSGHKLVNVVDPHIKRDSEYRIWKEAKENGYFIKNKDNSDDFQGWCWPGDSNWVDYLNPDASKWISEQFHLDKYNQSTKGLFIWNDMNEPSVFNGPEITMDKDIKHYGGWEHRDVHNIFGMLYHKATAEGLLTREEPPTRPFVLSRAYFAGSQRYGAIWTGDNTANWEHLKASIPMILSNNIAGLHFIGADVGGFFENPDPQLLTRWYQLGIWYPFFRAHAHIDTKRREPWLFGEPYLTHIRDAIRERYRLLPYWYTLFREASVSGMPIIRPMWMEFPKVPSLFAKEDSFMVGSAIMVVSPTSSESSETIGVQLPTQENWYNIKTQETYTAASRKLEFDNKLDTTLVFARGGSIIPTRERHRSSSALMKSDPFTLYVYVSSNGTASGKLYMDDGESYDYESGAFIERELKFADATLTSRASELTKDTAAYQEYIGKMAKVRVERVVIVGMRNPLTKAVISENGTTRTVDLEYHGSKTDRACVIRDPAVFVGGDWDIVLS
ncbi:glucosidase II [Coemansia sp. Benny D115]|nr:glucosidase II [Coemansia sp. Benny D115]